MLTSIRGWSDHVDRYSRRAYTLFEVMLSLALILALMTLIGTALNTHLRSQFHNRLQVEEAQLARALLNRIANDIRAVVLDAERDENTAGSNPSDDEADDMDAYSDFTDEYESDSTSYDDDYLYEYDIVGSKKGIYGGLDWIQIDTYRAIPGERFAVNTDNIYSDHYDDAEYLPELGLLSCGHKTVLYYLGYDTGMVEGDEEYQRGQKGT
ncbi:MAG: hypothetical protein FWD31_12190, partial [Planctomycetaceae bacterium]|nr:hypothetical protein [Planctomycetaceae bacterium]